MLKKGQTYFKIFAVFKLQDFESLLGYFSTLCMEELNFNPHRIFSYILYTILETVLLIFCLK